LSRTVVPTRRSRRVLRAVVAALGAAAALAGWTPTAAAYTANKVWFEFRPTGRYRVYVNYTVPELKEFREAWSEFATKQEAERFYWDLVRGADFYLPDPKARRFTAQPPAPQPW
jgi:hypothetical protein